MNKQIKTRPLVYPTIDEVNILGFGTVRLIISHMIKTSNKHKRNRRLCMYGNCKGTQVNVEVFAQTY